MVVMMFMRAAMAGRISVMVVIVSAAVGLNVVGMSRSRGEGASSGL